jgi:hypothetical protein
VRVCCRSAFVLILLAAACLSGHAQWLNYSTPRTPRTRDGKPNLTAAAPKAATGKPDLSGVWQVEATPVEEMKRLFGDLSADGALGDTTAAFSKYLINILLDFRPEETPLRHEYVNLVRQRSKQQTPLVHCLPIGIPADDLLPGPFKIIQTPELTIVRNEYENTFRQIYTDGRKPPADPEPLWLGYSVGEWEGDTLAVDTVGFNDKSWLDGIGHPHSEVLHLTERFHRRDFSVKFTELLLPDSDVTEYFCNENEKDGSHIK